MNMKSKDFLESNTTAIKNSKFANTAHFALKFRIPRLTGRTIPECWTSVELVMSSLTSCKIRIDLKNAYTCTHLEEVRCREIWMGVLQL